MKKLSVQVICQQYFSILNIFYNPFLQLKWSKNELKQITMQKFVLWSFITTVTTVTYFIKN